LSIEIRELLCVARVWCGGTRATLFGGAFCEVKYEKLWRRKSEDGNSFSPHPFFFPPRPREKL